MSKCGVTKLNNYKLRRPNLLNQLGSSIFSEVAAWKREALESGQDVIDLSIGSPDQPPSLKVRQALADAVMEEDQYAYPGISLGLPFKTQAALWMQYRFGVAINPMSEIVVLNGSQDGLAHLAMGIAERGSIALLPDPCYPIYAGSLALAGIEPYAMPLLEEHNYLPQLETIPEAILEKTSFMLLNYPNNPLTAVANLQFFEDVISFAKRHNIVIVHDLAYSEMGYDGEEPPSILQIEGAKDIAVELHSLSKSFNMAGCRIGFIVGNEEVLASFAKLKNNIDFGVFNPVQKAGIVALQEAMFDPQFKRASLIYQARRDAFVHALAEAGWTITPPKATMFAWIKLPPSHQTYSSREFTAQLLKATGVVVIPGDAFGPSGEGYIRIALVEDEARLIEAATRMGKFINKSS